MGLHTFSTLVCALHYSLRAKLVMIFYFLKTTLLLAISIIAVDSQLFDLTIGSHVEEVISLQTTPAVGTIIAVGCHLHVLQAAFAEYLATAFHLMSLSRHQRTNLTDAVIRGLSVDKAVIVSPRLFHCLTASVVRYLYLFSIVLRLCPAYTHGCHAMLYGGNVSRGKNSRILRFRGNSRMFSPAKDSCLRLNLEI